MKEGLPLQDVIMSRLNPLLVMELRRRLRKALTFIILAAPVVLFLFATYQMLAMNRMFFLFSPFGAMPTPQETGRLLFERLVFGYLSLALFIIPAVTAGAICRERELGTLEMLRLTRLSSLGIIGGKFMAGMSYVLLILIAPIPAVFVCRLIGGYSTGEFMKSILVTLCWTAAFGFASLLFSSFSGKTRAALITSYGFLATWLWATNSMPWFSWLLGGRWTAALNTAMELLNPYEAIDATFKSYTSVSLTLGRISGPSWLLSSGFALIMAVLCGLLAVVFLRLPIGLKNALGKSRRYKGQGFDPLVGFRKEPLLDHYNIVFQRDIRANRSVTRMMGIAYLVLGSLLLCALLTFIPRLSITLGILIATQTVIGFLILIGGCVAGSLALVTERENGTLESLRLTDLSPEDIIHGKFWSSFWSRGLLIAFLIPVAVGICIASPDPAIAAITTLLGLIGTLLACAVGVALGLNASVNAKKATSAVVTSVVVFGAWAFVVYLAGTFLFIFMMLFGMILDGIMRSLFRVGLEDFMDALPGTGYELVFLGGGIELLLFLLIVLFTLRTTLRSAANDLAIRMGRTSRFAKTRKRRLFGAQPLEADEREWRPRDAARLEPEIHPAAHTFPLPETSTSSSLPDSNPKEPAS